MTHKKLYAERDCQELGNYYIQNVMAMTAEGLHSKSDIAAELAYRDMIIDRLKKEISITPGLRKKVLALCDEIDEREGSITFSMIDLVHEIRQTLEKQNGIR